MQIQMNFKIVVFLFFLEKHLHAYQNYQKLKYIGDTKTQYLPIQLTHWFMYMLIISLICD